MARSVTGRSDLIKVTLDWKGDTDLAIKVFDGDKDFWLPKSQIQYDQTGVDVVEVELPQWLAKEKGLI